MTALKKLTEPVEDCRELRTTRGARARCVTDDGGAERLEIVDREGRLVFDYDVVSGRMTLLAPTGDLALGAPHGSLDLFAAKGIRVESAGEVALTSATGASVNVVGADGPSGMAVSREATTLVSKVLAVKAAQSELHLGRTRALIDKLSSQVARAELHFGRVTRRAERVVEEAGHLYQRVSELCELKAGRFRALVSGSIRMKGQDMFLSATERVDVDAEHINLG